MSLAALDARFRGHDKKDYFEKRNAVALARITIRVHLRLSAANF